MSDGVSPTDFGFTDQRNEVGLGLIDYNARYYDPYLGQFVSPDPIVPDPVTPQNFNRYAYVNNNPVRYTDPSGHCGPVCWTILALTVGYTAYDYLSQPDIAYAPNDAMAASDLPPSDLPGNEDALFASHSAIQDGNWPVAVGMAIVDSTPLDEIPGVSRAMKKLFRKVGLNNEDIGTLGYWANKGVVDLDRALTDATFFSERNVRVLGHSLHRIQERGFSTKEVYSLYSQQTVKEIWQTHDGNYMLVNAGRSMGVVTDNDGAIVSVLGKDEVDSAVNTAIERVFSYEVPWLNP